MLASVVTPRMLSGLDCVLLGGQAERVVTHCVEDVVTAHPHEAGEHVGADVAERVTDMETSTARIGEHVEDVELAPVGHGLEALGQRADRVRSPEGVVTLPAVLPLRLDLLRERGVVAVGGNVGKRAGGLSHEFVSVPGEKSRPPLVSWPPLGAVAQLVEHFHGMEGVRGSIPLSSTPQRGAAIGAPGTAQ